MFQPLAPRVEDKIGCDTCLGREGMDTSAILGLFNNILLGNGKWVKWML